MNDATRWRTSTFALAFLLLLLLALVFVGRRPKELDDEIPF